MVKIHPPGMVPEEARFFTYTLMDAVGLRMWKGAWISKTGIQQERA